MTPHVLPLLVRSSLAALLLGVAASAQVRHPGAPAGARTPEAPIPTVRIAAPDIAALAAEDARRTAEGVVGPVRYGVPLELPLAFEDEALWQHTGDGELLVGRLALTSPGALNLGLELEVYDLPPQGRLFVYDADDGTVLGAYTSTERHPDGGLVVQPLPGERLVIEYAQPADTAGLPRLRVGRLIYGYRDVYALLAAEDGGCPLVDVNCPEGDPYPNQKRATVRTLNGGGFCSGVLINNTANDGTPYVYTANHCQQGPGMVVFFNYQNAGCGVGPAPDGQTTSGAVLLANDQDTDGRLLRITSAVPASYEPYFAGWSLSTEDLAFGLSMHHPFAMPKKLSIDLNGGGMTTGTYFGIGTVKVWEVVWDVGDLLTGSSGGPLFDEAGRLRGTLTGAQFDCSGQYGRFHNFWADVGLATWLDPLGTGAASLDGYEPCPPAAAGESVRLGAPANPPALLPGATSGPVLGATWDPAVDHASFATDAVLDVLVVGAGAVNVPSAIGTILCDPAGPLLSFTSTPGAPFAVPVPAVCSFAGQALCSQGAAVNAAGAIALTNALDLTLGTL
ncbi:MAG: hypothetical protein AAF682_13085 [Planctomycetota bacterium]